MSLLVHVIEVVPFNIGKLQYHLTSIDLWSAYFGRKPKLYTQRDFILTLKDLGYLVY